MSEIVATGRRAEAIAPIAVLPVFFKLAGRRALLAGDTPPAAWKAELLAAAGATVLICAPDPCPALLQAAEVLGPRATLLRRPWTEADFAGAAIAIGALEGAAAQAFFTAAQRAGVPVNVIDVPAACDFQFGTLIGRSPLVIGISTDGAAPVFGQALRARIEALLPAEIGLWAEAAKAWRPALQDLALSFAARRRFWEVFADRALAGRGLSPSEADRQACLAAARGAEAATPGRIILVGVGPGEADQVTLRAVRALQSADVILHEVGLEPALLALGRREAQRFIAPPELAEAVALAAAFSRDQKTVAWVDCGTPACCAPWRRRAEALAAAGCSPELVEGLRCKDCSRVSQKTIG